jgi:hypothetical protein
MRWIFRTLMVGSGLLLLILLAGALWFIAIPVGLLVLVYLGFKARKVGRNVVKEVNRFLDEPLQ